MILALETSTSQGSLALLDPATGDVIRSVEFHSDRAHNGALFPPLETLLASAPAPLSLIIAGTGPGSYGGVRSGISAVLGLSLARRCPLIGLPSIVTLAPDALVAGDARRSLFFLAEVRSHRLMAFPALHAPASFETAVKEASLPVLTMDPAPPLGLPGIEIRYPSAACLARLAFRMTAAERSELAGRPLEPLYIRPPFITQPKPGRTVP